MESGVESGMESNVESGLEWRAGLGVGMELEEGRGEPRDGGQFG
jgi:hypothetical protein